MAWLRGRFHRRDSHHRRTLALLRSVAMCKSRDLKASVLFTLSSREAVSSGNEVSEKTLSRQLVTRSSSLPSSRCNLLSLLW
jgi:hypothetical protein